MAKDEEKDSKADEADAGESAVDEKAAESDPKPGAKAPAAASKDAPADEDESEDEEDEESDDEEDEESDPVAAKDAKAEAHTDHAHAEEDAHAHDDEPEPPLEKDTPKMKIITGAFVVVAVLVIGTVIGTRAFYNSLFLGEQHRKVGQPVAESLIELHKLEEKHLTTYQWVDEKKGVVRIPVVKAREAVLAHYQATPIETEAPPPPPPPKDSNDDLGDWTDLVLPGDVKINALAAGVEAKLLAFVQDKEKPVDEAAPPESWFDFDHLLFATGKATLEPESEKQLKNIAEILKAFPNLELKIGAYTDNTGDADANKKLSQERADAVVAELEKLGIDKKRLKAEGYGQEHPVASNDTDEGKAKNRRVAVRVTKK